MIYTVVSLTVEELRRYTPDTVPKPSDQQISDFYVRIGLTVAAWQFVESIMASLYGRVIKSANFEALAASLHVPTNFRVRLDMTHEAIKRVISDATLLSEWEKLYKRVVEKSKRRNQLAHSVVFFDPKQPKQDRQLFISASFADPTRFDSSFPQSSIITQKQLGDMVTTFDALYNDLVMFLQKIP